MTRYELLFVLHIISVIIWLGAGFLMAVLIYGAERAGDAEKESRYHQDVGWLSTRLFIPASLGTFILGLLLVIDGPWTFDQLWITIGMTGWLISFGLGFFYFRPEAERIGALVGERGLADPEVERRLLRVNRVERVQLVILFAVVANMVLKPTGDDADLLIGGALLIATSIALAVMSLRRRAIA